MKTYRFYGLKELYIRTLNAVTANADIINCKISWTDDTNVKGYGWTELTIKPKDLFWIGISVGQRIR